MNTTDTASNKSARTQTRRVPVRHAGASPAALTGQAIGDALGCAFEFRPASDLGLVRWQGEMRGGMWGLKAGQFTDDTKMALVIARSLLARGRYDGRDIMRGYVAWVKTGDLRGIGGTCSSSIHAYMRDPDINTCGARGEYAAGNGTAMRVCPVGMLYRGDMVPVISRAINDADLTHANTEARAGSVAVAMGVALLSTGLSPETALDRVIAESPFPASKVVANLAAARELLRHNRPNVNALTKLGTSGYVVHTVAASFYALCATANFRDAVILGVKGGGDADTTGAVVGALAGAFYGVEGLPADYLEVLEDRDGFLALDRDLRTRSV